MNTKQSTWLSIRSSVLSLLEKSLKPVSVVHSIAVKQCCIQIASLGILLLLLPLLAWGMSPAERLSNPKPAEGDLILPMPGNLMMVFRKIPVPGKGFWGDESSVIQLGDASGGIFEGLQRKQIAGSFIDEDGLRYLVLAKYELTVAQFAAVMEIEHLLKISDDPDIARLPELSNPERMERLGRPLTYVPHSEIQQFVVRYNEWLFDEGHSERRENLPQSEGVPGYIRLPTEEEWEYAARGGRVALDAGFFNDRLPFDAAQLNDHAWHLGNARHELRPVGLREANSLGLHDMLGNAQEMTASRFRPEFGQGKPGGIAVRGGTASTPKGEMRSSLRTELDEFAWDPDREHMEQRRSFNTGVRLAIGSNVILGSEQQERIEQEYNQYRERMRSVTPVGRSLDNLVVQASGQLDDMNELLQQLIVANPSLRDPLTRLQAQADQARVQLAQAEKTRARSLVQDATRNGANLSFHVSKLPSLESARENARKLVEHSTRYDAQLQKVEKLIDAQKRSIDEQLSAYGDKLSELADTQPKYVADAFVTLSERRMTTREHAVLNLLEEHVQRYHEIRRNEPGKWLEDYSSRFANFEDG